MKQRITLTVDGHPVSMDVEPDMPLLYALRGEAGSINPKFGCGLAQCGACTVQVNGEAIRSCIIPVSAVADSDIITLAGLGNGEDAHPLQRAFIEEQVPQCGYCLSGWMMTAAAFLKRNPDPSDAEIRAALAGIKCRCGTHMAILRAVKRAASYARA